MIWIITIALVIFAAVCKATADTLAHHFTVSIFKDKPRGFWDPTVITKTVPAIFGYPLDAWHLLNSGMIVAMITAVALHQPALRWYFEIPIGGALWNLTFNLFYNKLLMHKDYAR
jgi:hypothetical protein